MGRKKIFTVGFELPGDEFEYVEFESNQTLLDADIILFRPTLGDCHYGSDHDGRPVLNEHSSSSVKRHLDHWRNEIVAAVKAGRLVIIYLAEPDECLRYTGERQFSGTGRNQKITHMVTSVSSYDAVPNVGKVTPKSGSEVQLTKDVPYLRSYWSQFEGPYEVEIDGASKTVALRSKVGDRVVGAAIHGKEGGVLLFLPPLAYDEDDFLVENEKAQLSWTKEAIVFGKRLVSALVALADALRQSVQTTPPPEWTLASGYRLAAETELELIISENAAAILHLQSEKAKLEGELKASGSLRRLLYEQGKPLEAAVIEAMKLFGYDAKPFADGTSEFDGVFVSKEARCLGEVEGKDNKPINIEKFSQLERNLQEDFARDEVVKHAKGILFGNAFRLEPLDQRSEPFTAKCVSAAKRIGAALVKTSDMFAPAKYLREHPSDSDYAEQCRLAIFRAEGDVVAFPDPPISDAATLSESPERDPDGSNLDPND